MAAFSMSTAIHSEVTPCLFKPELLNWSILTIDRLFWFEGLCPEPMRQIPLPLQ